MSTSLASLRGRIATAWSPATHLVPLVSGLATAVAVYLIDEFLARHHLPADATLLDDVLLGILVAFLITILQQRFQAALGQLQSFTSDASHQLRTPLAILRNLGEVALQRPLPQAQYQDVIGSMLEEVSRLTRLVENLLLIARMDAGQVRLQRGQFRACDLVRSVVSALEVLAQEKSQVLSTGADDSTVIEGDEGMLRQALMNVLHNAIKYTPEKGQIAVQTRVSPPGFVEIIVSDNGPGISSEGHGRIFDRFQRLSADHTGSGLGLPICKWITEAHHGEISCHSRPGGGCQFIMKLPVKQ